MCASVSSFALRAGLLLGEVVFSAATACGFVFIAEVSMISVFLVLVALGCGGLNEVWSKSAELVADYY